MLRGRGVSVFLGIFLVRAVAWRGVALLTGAQDHDVMAIFGDKTTTE